MAMTTITITTQYPITRSLVRAGGHRVARRRQPPLRRADQRRYEVRVLPGSRSTAPYPDCRVLLERMGIRRVPRQLSRTYALPGREPAPRFLVPIRTCRGNATPVDRSGSTLAPPEPSL